MDYKQKYEEALGWMQSLYNGLHGKTKEEAEHFFPELAESEDERIRKLILLTIKSQGFISDEETLRQCVAWLEKQGEQKPADEQSEDCDTTNDNDLAKSNRKKCEEISELDWSGEAPEDRIYQAAYIMAEWKDHQFKGEKQALIEKACEWLRNVTYFDYGAPMFDYGTFIKDFQKAMKGE